MKIKQYLLNDDKNCRLPEHRWVNPETHYPYRDVLHRKSKGSNCFLKFRCNDPACTAKMEILWRSAEIALGIRDPK